MSPETSNLLSLAVRIAPMSHMRDGDELGLVVNHVQYPVVSNSHAVLVFRAFELGASVRTRSLLQPQNSRVHLSEHLKRQTLDIPLGRGSDSNLVGHGL